MNYFFLIIAFLFTVKLLSIGATEDVSWSEYTNPTKFSKIGYLATDASVHDLIIEVDIAGISGEIDQVERLYLQILNEGGK